MTTRITSNVKNGHPKMTAEQKAAKKEWEEAHPGEKYPMDWNLSLNYEFDRCEDGDVSKSACCPAQAMILLLIWMFRTRC